MGIPSLFKKIVTNNPNLLTSTINEVNTFYIDFNCLIHEASRGVTNDNPHVKESLTACASMNDETVIVNTIKLLINLVSKIRPKHTFIAMDGPVPKSKMMKQRERRFRKTEDGVECDPYRFDSNAITPGTLFMEKLSERIRSSIHFDAFPCETVVFSDYHEIGEGEHKIYSHINSSPDDTGTLVIYGMDADLIVLSMASAHFQRIVLCRESMDLNTLTFLSMNTCLSTLQIEPHRHLDFVLALMLGGNDFVPAIECLKIRDRGWESIHSRFKQTTYPLSTDKKIHWDNLKTFLHELALTEKTALQSQRKRSLSKVPQPTEDVYHHGYFHDQSHPLFDLYGEQSRKSIVERDNYYEFIIGTCEPNVINDMCNCFVASIDWCWDYYVHGNITSWEFHYPFVAAPRLEDIYEHYDAAVTRVHNQKHACNEKCEAYTPVVQLLCVLPKESTYLLPNVLREVVCDDYNPLESWYVDHVLIEPITGQKMIYSNSFLADIETDHARVMVDVCSHLFDADETKRNSISVVSGYGSAG